jgi:hypothetical protein
LPVWPIVSSPGAASLAGFYGLRCVLLVLFVSLASFALSPDCSAITARYRLLPLGFCF